LGYNCNYPYFCHPLKEGRFGEVPEWPKGTVC
jgi:hypothetical protein